MAWLVRTTITVPGSILVTRSRSRSRSLSESWARAICGKQNAPKVARAYKDRDDVNVPLRINIPCRNVMHANDHTDKRVPASQGKETICQTFIFVRSLLRAYARFT